MAEFEDKRRSHSFYSKSTPFDTTCISPAAANDNWNQNNGPMGNHFLWNSRQNPTPSSAWCIKKTGRYGPNLIALWWGFGDVYRFPTSHVCLHFNVNFIWMRAADMIKGMGVKESVSSGDVKKLFIVMDGALKDGNTCGKVICINPGFRIRAELSKSASKPVAYLFKALTRKTGQIGSFLRFNQMPSFRADLVWGPLIHMNLSISQTCAPPSSIRLVSGWTTCKN